VQFSPNVVLIGDGLVLREWTGTDLDAMVTLFDEESIDVWTPLAAPFDQDAAQRYLDGARRGRDAGACLQLAITTDGRTPLGEVLLFDGAEPRSAELAYAVGVAHRGQRLASRAMRLVMAFARGSCGISAFELKISIANGASQAAARAAGFEPVGGPVEIRERKGRRLELALWHAGDQC
jgi:RimJ/RimL family protein N-acetyltransferase